MDIRYVDPGDETVKNNCLCSLVLLIKIFFQLVSIYYYDLKLKRDIINHGLTPLYQEESLTEKAYFKSSR